MMSFSYLMIIALWLPTMLSQQCSRINFSSDGVHPDDLVKKGITTSVWSSDASNPIIIGSSKKQDYIYVLVEADSGAFDNSNFSLDYDNQKYANSSFTLDKSRKEGTDYYEYAVRIVYHCNNYGGALVNYKLSFNLPGCGQSYVHWKKLCGNPTQPRDGFTVDLEENGKNRTIVKNGMLVNSLEFDQDLDNYFYSVSEDIHKTVFFMKMDSQTPQEQSPQEDPLISILRDVVMTTPETKISAPRVDADSSVLTPNISGAMAQFGGILNTNVQRMEVGYDCLNRNQNSYVEVTIPLDYFKDISLFFRKECRTYSYFNIFGAFKATSFLSFLFRLIIGLLTIVIMGGGIIYLAKRVNEKYKDQRINAILEKIASMPWIRDSKLSKQLIDYKELNQVDRQKQQEVNINMDSNEDDTKTKEIKTNYGTL